MVNFLQYIFHTPVKIKNGGKMKHSFVRYIGCVYIVSQKISQIQAYHRKTYCNFTIQRCYSLQQKTFLSYKVANKSY